MFNQFFEGIETLVETICDKKLTLLPYFELFRKVFSINRCLEF